MGGSFGLESDRSESQPWIANLRVRAVLKCDLGIR